MSWESAVLNLSIAPVLVTTVYLIVLAVTARPQPLGLVLLVPVFVLRAAAHLALGEVPDAGFASVSAAICLYFWRRGGGGKGGWRRLKRWARSKLPRPSFVRLRPGVGAAPA